jgi:hypothetical protein
MAKKIITYKAEQIFTQSELYALISEVNEELSNELEDDDRAEQIPELPIEGHVTPSQYQSVAEALLKHDREVSKYCSQNKEHVRYYMGRGFLYGIT